MIEALGLTDITAVHGRAEDYGRDPKYREQFDLCVSRAVANMSTLSEYCIPFVKKGGYFIPYKSGKADEEIEQAKSAVKKLGGELKEVIVKVLPETMWNAPLSRSRRWQSLQRNIRERRDFRGRNR